MTDQEAKIREIRAKITDLKKRWPRHSAKPSMFQELEDLETELATLLSEKDPKQHADH